MARPTLAAESVGQVLVAGRHGRHRLEFTEYGSGEAWVVLLPALLGSRADHDRLARVLAGAGLHVLALDPLGHGRSDRPADPLAHSVTVAAEHVVALLDDVGAPRAVLLGTSWGANVALETATIAPERVAGLVLDAPVLDNALAAQLAVLAPVLYAARFAPLALGAAGAATRLGSAVTPAPLRPRPLGRVAAALRAGSGPVAALVHGTLFGRLAPSAVERAALRVPTLVVARRRDPLHPASDAALVAGEIDGAVLEVARERREWARRPERLDLATTAFALECLRAERTRRPRRSRSS
ncbi:alpha/beta fold hydrolase [Nocardioides sp.]|uniref:alpha/beta fold hydrolase n=1 Tax=Nocardioides sp. TaxID=35761 RepID=UPI003515B489